MIRKAARNLENAIESGGFVARAAFPGHLEPGHGDHGLGPLATIMESFLAPGTHIKLHEHVQDEIVSWVPAGVMRHDDPQGGPLIVDADHLMVMNAGHGFWHEEKTDEGDPPLRMLQIFVRPHTADLAPGIQHGRLPAPTPNVWRPVFGPPGSDAPFHVRNSVACHDIRLAAGQTTELPTAKDRQIYFFVFTGCVRSDEQTFGEAETGLLPIGASRSLRALEDSLVVAFVIDPNAPIHRGGTVGDGETVRRVAGQARRLVEDGHAGEIA